MEVKRKGCKKGERKCVKRRKKKGKGSERGREHKSIEGGGRERERN